MRILITGGAGYIAYNLINQLHKYEEVSAILIYDNLAYSNSNFLMGNYLEKVQFIEGDILDTPKLEEVLNKVDVVYHMAAYVQNAYNYMQSLQYYQVNQWGTLSLIRAIKKKDTIQKFIYLSSAAVYGFTDNIKEDQSVRPVNDYAKSKYSGEQYAQSLNDKCEVHIVRMANVYGFNPCFRKDSVINSFITEALLYKKNLIFGNGEQKRAFININEAANYLTNLLFAESQSTLRVCYGFSASVNEIYEILLDQIPNLECSYVNQDLQFESQSFVNSKIRQHHKEDIVHTLFDFRNNFRMLKN